MIWYTSDWHLGENRLGGDNGKPNVFYRPFKTTEENDLTVVNNFLEYVKPGDVVYNLGDVMINTNPETIQWLDLIKSSTQGVDMRLLVGNYDEDKLNLLSKYFTIVTDGQIGSYYMSHYPVNCIGKDKALTGHIHGLWKVQKNMINVGVDAWHFKPVSEDTVNFCFNAMDKFYDQNVFPYV